MPIHDVTYRHWSGEWTSHPYRWWVITRQGISLLIRKKRFVALMILSAIPFLVRTVILYLSVVVGQLGFLKIDAKFFEDFLTQQLFFAFVIAIYAGAGLIANDLKANALQIYLSKPLTRKDYVIGKLGVVAVFLSLPTLVPGLLLFVLAVAFHSNLDFLQQNYWVTGSIVMYSLTIILTYGLVVLALSALSKSSRFAGIGFADRRADGWLVGRAEGRVGSGLAKLEPRNAEPLQLHRRRAEQPVIVAVVAALDFAIG